MSLLHFKEAFSKNHSYPLIKFMYTVNITIGHQTLSIETGTLAKQANGSVLVRYGDTVVLVTSTATNSSEPQDFFPLSVHYIEKAYATGKIPGGFFKREGKLSDAETLTSRIIDRSIRPLFDPNFCAETSVIATVLSYDLVHHPDFVSLIGASASLMVSDLPFHNPIAGGRVARIDGQFVFNPSHIDLKKSDLDIFMAGSEDAIVMVEGEAKEVSEKVMIDALMFGHDQIKTMLPMQHELAKLGGKTKITPPAVEVDSDLRQKVHSVALPKITNAFSISTKQERYASLDQAKEDVLAEFVSEENDISSDVQTVFDDTKKEVMRQKILKEGSRIDGRKTDEIRPIECKTGLLPRSHGSALFTRGETQALMALTLGTTDDQQMVDSLSEVVYKSFLLHYNFPAFSVGEARPPRPPGRREIGHGTLAERALSAVLPSFDDFPYMIRLVSEILESNGSSSMATVCAGSLALMDVGVPISAPVAGIAMGLIHEGKKTAILSDILGDEDHLGDMDFKVAGTKDGVTALQMDIKISGINRKIIEKALTQAKAGRLHILKEMSKELHAPREKLSSYAPRCIRHKVPAEKIRDIIGPGGKNIKALIEKTGAKINVSDDGIVSILAQNSASAELALHEIEDMTRVVELGKEYDARVVKIMEFGAFVELFPGQQGLVHISNIQKGHVDKVENFLKEGQEVRVLAMSLDRRGKLQLSMKDCQENN